LRWSAVYDQKRAFLRLAGNLWRFWSMRGPVAEGRTWLDQAVEVCESNASNLETKLITAVFGGAGELARAQGDFERALLLKQRFLEMCRQWGNERYVAATLTDLANMFANDNQCERSLALAEEALAICRKLGLPLGVAHALLGSAFALMCLDQSQAAREATEEAIQISRVQQYQEFLVVGRLTLSLIATRQKQYDEAQRLIEELLPVVREIADQELIVSSLYGMGILAATQGQARQAARLLGAAVQIATLGGFWFEIPGRAWVEYTILAAKAHVGEAVWAQDYQAGQALATVSALTIEQAIAFSLEKSDD